MPEAYLSGKEGLFPTARPAEGHRHRWSSGWAVGCELSTTNESATASAIGSAIGLHPATVRRALRRLEADGLVSRSEGLWSRNTSLASEPIAGEGLVDHAAERRLRHEQDRERRRRWVSHLHDADDVIDLATERIKREAAGEATGDAFASGLSDGAGERRDQGSALARRGSPRHHRSARRTVRAECRGDQGVTYEPAHENGSWLCVCDARGLCSHVIAAMLVTSPERLRRLCREMGQSSLPRSDSA